MVQEQNFKSEPQWNSNSGEPVLVVKDAIACAQKTLREAFPSSQEWALSALELSRFENDHWLYHVTFEEPGPKHPRPESLCFPVFLSGKVIKPRHH